MTDLFAYTDPGSGSMLPGVVVVVLVVAVVALWVWRRRSRKVGP